MITKTMNIHLMKYFMENVILFSILLSLRKLENGIFLIHLPKFQTKGKSTRWVCTRKIKGGKVVHKARLVARGFEENSKLLQTDSPTCSKESLRLLLSIISSHSWRLHSLDVKSAFLQGAHMKRQVFIRTPKEANTKSL